MHRKDILSHTIGTLKFFTFLLSKKPKQQVFTQQETQELQLFSQNLEQ